MLKYQIEKTFGELSIDSSNKVFIHLDDNVCLSIVETLAKL